MLNKVLNTYAEPNEKNPKFQVGDYVRISKDKKFFAKGYVPIC